MGDISLQIWNHLVDIGLIMDDISQVIRVGGRLLLALMLGACLGWEREQRGRAAGLRTHILVALGAALFTIVAIESASSYEDRPLVLSQVIRGIAAGVGFLGAGAILKRSENDEVKGLTTAATIWLTAAAGMSVGAGWFWPAAGGIFLSWLVLALSRMNDKQKDTEE